MLEAGAELGPGAALAPDAALGGAVSVSCGDWTACVLVDVGMAGGAPVGSSGEALLPEPPDPMESSFCCCNLLGEARTFSPAFAVDDSSALASATDAMPAMAFRCRQIRKLLFIWGLSVT